MNKQQATSSKFNLNFTILMLLVVIFYSGCQKEKLKNASDSKAQNGTLGKNGLTYSNEEDSFFVEQDIARIYAQYMNAADTSFHGQSQRTIISEYPIVDEDETPCMWVFNYADNGGWVILSADYRLEPIMAYNNEGTFSPDTIPNALGMWVDGSIASISILRLGEYDNTFKGLNAWQTTQTEYNVLPRLSGKKNMPKDGDDPQDPLCIRGFRRIKGPLLQTTWGQMCTYNDLISTICSNTNNCNRAPTGCVATSIAQVMQYFHKPSSNFNYNIMSLNNGNNEVARLMEDIGDNVKMDYKCEGSGSGFQDYKKVLKDVYGYQNSEGKDYNLGELLLNISNNKPVILSGCRTQTISGKKWNRLWIPKVTYSNCHAWDCDGYTKTEYCTYSTINYLHMNWGWHEVWPITFDQRGNDFNGWYWYNDWNIPIPNGNRNYQFINEMVCNINP